MTRIRIHFGYRHVNKPWGGANNFIRALYQNLAKTGRYLFTENIADECDLLFLNQLSKGPGNGSENWPLDLIKQIKSRGKMCKLIVRAVNLNSHAFRMGIRNLLFGQRIDRDVLSLLNMADMVIFQSVYQRDFFTTAGYKGARNTIIHNGADNSFWIEAPPSLLSTPLRLISSTASPRPTKNHGLIARFAQLPDVEVSHLGNWPKGENPSKVRLLGILPREEMVRAFMGHHYFLHPAVKDPCPNAIFEAIVAGLPVIYNPGPGSGTEIVGNNGLPLDEANLEKTAQIARKMFPELQAAVLRNRNYYSIDRAMQQYIEVFEAAIKQ